MYSYRVELWNRFRQKNAIQVEKYVQFLSLFFLFVGEISPLGWDRRGAAVVESLSRPREPQEMKG